MELYLQGTQVYGTRVSRGIVKFKNSSLASAMVAIFMEPEF